MGVRILEGKDGNAVLFSSSTDWCFGPLFGNLEEAELFLKILEPTDPRLMTDTELQNAYSDFVQRYVCECGGLRDELDAEVKANEKFGECICDDRGDCDWCKAKAENLDPEKTEARFACYQCARKAVAR